MRLEHQIAIVTGAGSGIGRAVAHRLADEGCRVVAVGRREDRLRETVANYSGSGSIVPQPADVGERQQVAQLVANVRERFGPVDVLVNNAGVNIRDRRLERLTPENWDHLIRVNLTGAFLMIHAVLPEMRARGRGLIINVSSIAGLRPSVLGGAAYSAGKSGLNALSTVLSLEEGKNGVKSTLICPGEVETPILDDRPEPVSAERRATMLQPHDIADAVAFIANLPPRAHIPWLVITPTVQPFA
jgi:NADP-dependent 3-hydroxy acid dehydrogenase YdfG